ncbi:MAG: hypothetical protein KDH88_12670 [Chromatiales bacterium]|nr:hypothetical protein [Chromatiales bacterium]
MLCAIVSSLLSSSLFTSPFVLAFDSGSTGADGAFSPSVDTRLDLPESGVFNFSSLTIPEGVTVTFNKNTANTPVVILVNGDASIAGSIDVSGFNSPGVGAAGDGNAGDDGLPGLGGPGGYDGGAGGAAGGDHFGGNGLGPGGGNFGTGDSTIRRHGGGGSYSTRGSYTSYRFAECASHSAEAGPIYGSSVLLPLLGGSGGGGGMGGNAFAGSGGGGGGGALLMAVSGTLRVDGAIVAVGGQAGTSGGGNCGAVGGGGSGGAIRLVASVIEGNGTVSAAGANRPNSASCSVSGYSYQENNCYMHSGGDGRIRLEADNLVRTAGSTPAYTFGPPGDLFVAGLPTLRISRVAGVDAPATPSGVADIVLPADIANPVTVEFETTGIPLGNIVELTVTPQKGAATSAISNALAGDTGLATAATQIALPQGPSTLMASITYTLIADSDARRGYFERLAGEPVQGIRVEAGIRGESRYWLITESGKSLPLSPAQLASAG